MALFGKPAPAPNTDALNNRRVNDKRRAQLQWLTNKENMAKRLGVISIPRSPEACIPEIPY